MGFNKLYPFKYAPAGILLNQNDRFVTGAVAAAGEFSEGEVDMFRDILQPEDIVVEVGANMGAHTLALASLVRGVVAFEPQRYIFQVLCANLANNSITNVVAMPMAVGATNGLVTVPLLDPNHADTNYGSLSLTEIHDSGETVELMALDRLGINDVALLKLDCEGMELDVLQGAVELLKRNKPWIYLEFTANRAALLEFLHSHDYKTFRHFPRHIRWPNFLGTEKPENPVEYSSDMVLACPIGRTPRPTMEKGFGERHFLVQADTEDYFGKTLGNTIWEPYVRID